MQRHGFVLDLGSARSAPRSTVYVRLLGPFSARSDLPSVALIRIYTRCLSNSWNTSVTRSLALSWDQVVHVMPLIIFVARICV